MGKLLGFIGATVGGAIGWWAGEQIGGMMTAFIISTIASGFGIYYGRKFAAQIEP